jgi:hypothetical protein
LTLTMISLASPMEILLGLPSLGVSLGLEILIPEELAMVG